ncbi:hypothetical protein [Pediococcus cellicola]|uniref:Uncharacterized protein n=1 Tax=Pediococcus cellicola TaxID=319652 RepID=A0A0R2IPX8_9LACO|nr:hypothetical protein [Pediococcus cellicola]KRN65430.1 hypothetical protein IV80_GL001936 [Pediococcus cellicola]GEL15330.1 hypothetical protein PCE01_11320 [Pediococcus cellicola]
MLYQYPTLAQINETGHAIQVNEDSIIQKLPHLTGVDYFVKSKDQHNYYVFIDRGDQGGAVIHADNYSDLGFFLIETPLSDFYLDINPDTSLIEMYDGAGVVTDFSDAVEKDEIQKMLRTYQDASDSEIEASSVYKELDKYVSQYLELDDDTEKNVNLAIIRIAILSIEQTVLSD